MTYFSLFAPRWLCAGLLTSSVAIAQSVDNGFQIMFNQRAGNCTACHSIPDVNGKKNSIQSTFAPPLDAVALRYTQPTLMQWVTDARKLNSQTLMPPFGMDLGNGRLLTDAQIADVVAALQTLR